MLSANKKRDAILYGSAERFETHLHFLKNTVQSFKNAMITKSKS